MKKESNIIGYDFQGWPIYKLSLRDILKNLGVKKKCGFWMIPDKEILDIYPRTLEDDGMGYGVNDKYITNVDIVNGKWCNIFIEAQHDTTGDN